jgi:uncharacterized membrane protein YraQ (UPF0718 family)
VDEKQAYDFILIFTSILYEAMPFIVLGAVIAGILEEMVPQGLITKLVPRNPFLSIPLAAALGLIFPMCECGIIPVMRRLLRKGLPLSCCTAYLLAGPIINIVVILSTAVAFSGMENAKDSSGRPLHQMGAAWMVGLRVGLGYLVAIGTSLIVEWQYRKHGNKLLLPIATPSNLPMVDDDEGNGNGKRMRVFDRIGRIAETALHDFVDITVFLILGAMLAAVTRLFLTPDRLAEISSNHWVLTILAMMALAILLCLCSEADAFVAASFITVRPSAKVAFLVLGPMLDLKLYLMYTRVFRPRLIWTIILSVVVQVFIYSVLTHLLWEYVAVPRLWPGTP